MDHEDDDFDGFFGVSYRGKKYFGNRLKFFLCFYSVSLLCWISFWVEGLVIFSRCIDVVFPISLFLYLRKLDLIIHDSSGF